MSRRLLWSKDIREMLASVKPLSLKIEITDTILDLLNEPEPPNSLPYGGIPGAHEILADTFDMRYTYGDDHVSVWVIRVHEP